jgi:hypothetical protein
MALVKAYEDGAGIKELVDRYGINRSTVLNHLDRHGIARRGQVFKLKDSQVVEAAGLRNEGWSFIRIGRHLGVSDGTVASSIRRAGFEPTTWSDSEGSGVSGCSQ